MGSLDVTSGVVGLPRRSENEHPDVSENLHTENPRSDKNKNRFLLIMEKVNMVFLIVLVCYLSWTIPATFGLFDPPSAASSSTILQNDNTSLLNQTDSLIVSINKIFIFFKISITCIITKFYIVAESVLIPLINKMVIKPPPPSFY